MERRVYLDHAATTPLRPEARTAMEPFLTETFGNPSSLHSYGRDARAALEGARADVRQTLGATEGTVVFTGSGSESDNLAILGFARRRPGGTVIRSTIEHKAVIRATDALERSGYDVRVAPVDESGVVQLDALEEQIPTDGRPVLISVMWANNETGVVQPIDSIVRLAHETGAQVHTDAVQAFGKVPLSAADVPADLISISGHKIGGPKGVGALYVRDGLELEPIVHGGGHEEGLRSGTQNVAGVVGLSMAARLAVMELEERRPWWAGLRDRLQADLAAALPGLRINGGDAPERTPHVLNLSIPNVDIEGLITALDLEGICVSTGSACTTGSVEPSHVMVAMGRAGESARNTIRISLGWTSTERDIDYVAQVLPRVVERVRAYAA